MTRAAVKTAVPVAAAVLAATAPMLFGVEATTTPPNPTVTADQLRAQLARERSHHRTQLVRLSRENRRLRSRPPSPFTEKDTRIAAELVGLVGGWPVHGALAVAWCESHHQPYARNRTALSGSHATGAWQLLYDAAGRRSSTWHTTDVGRAIDAPTNPYVNAWVAYRVWQRNSNSFREWNDICARQG
jgi:hypothetical protein